MNIVKDVINPTLKESGDSIINKIIGKLPFVRRRFDIEFSEEMNNSDFEKRFIDLLTYYKKQGMEQYDVVELFKKQLEKGGYMIDALPKMVYKYWKVI